MEKISKAKMKKEAMKIALGIMESDRESLMQYEKYSIYGDEDGKKIADMISDYLLEKGFIEGGYV